MTNHERFKIAMADYYKVERDRAERCLGDLLTIMTDDGIDSTDKLIDRLTAYYSRVDGEGLKDG